MSLTPAMIDAFLAAGGTAEQLAAMIKADLHEQQERAARQIPWPKLRAMAFERDGEVCAYCKCTDGPFEVDHVIPQSKGGENVLENVAVACRSCNRAKKDREGEEWGNLHTRRQNDRERKRRQRDNQRSHVTVTGQAADNAERPKKSDPDKKDPQTPKRINPENTPPIVPPKPRAARLSDPFTAPQDWLDWAAKERGWSVADARHEAECFADYWHAKAGRDACKLDWEATWRNWVRNSRRGTGARAWAVPSGMPLA